MKFETKIGIQIKVIGVGLAILTVYCGLNNTVSAILNP